MAEEERGGRDGGREKERRTEGWGPAFKSGLEPEADYFETRTTCLNVETVEKGALQQRAREGVLSWRQSVKKQLHRPFRD